MKEEIRKLVESVLKDSDTRITDIKIIWEGNNPRRVVITSTTSSDL